MAGPVESAGAADVPVLSAGEVARIAVDVFDAIPSPALLLEMPSGRIVAATPAAAKLLDPTGSMIAGHLFEEFTTDSPAVGPELFAGARLNGFETVRTVRRETEPDQPDQPGQPVRMWIRSFDGQPSSRFVVAVIVVDLDVPPGETADLPDASAIVGTADSQLLIERISSDAEEVFERSVTKLLGVRLLSLVVAEDESNCLAASSVASSSGTGVALNVTLRAGADGDRAIPCEMLIVPLEPSPSCAFILLPIGESAHRGHDRAGLTALLLRVRRGAEVAQLVKGHFQTLSERRLPGLGRLTTRELEIVTRLLDGDRPPAIARALFLSQSTVRNHLASVFSKLGVNSQQELLHAVRDS